MRAYGKEYNKKYPHKRREIKLRNKYGVSLEEYDRMVCRQGNRCAICKSEPTDRELGAKLYIDHDHRTGKVRGLLCSDCNHGLGMFRDEIARLQQAVRYLRKGSTMKKGSEPFERRPDEDGKEG
jgi:hypothetical protein